MDVLTLPSAVPVLGEKGWARVRPQGAHFLRRGAWYPVVTDRGSSLIVLDVARRNVPVSRESVELRAVKPEAFSVVIRSPNDPKPGKINGKELGLTYAVCPVTRARVPYSGRPQTLACPVCEDDHPVDWETTC